MIQTPEDKRKSDLKRDGKPTGIPEVRRAKDEDLNVLKKTKDLLGNSLT